MPDLLEDIAENDTAVMNGWAALFNETAPRIEALPQDKRARELLTLARAFTRRAAWAADTADGWREEFYARLRVGMSRFRMRPLLDSGRELCRMCRSVLEIAGDLWRLAETANTPPADVLIEARTVLTAAARRVASVEDEIAVFTARTERRLTEADWARMAAGIQHGKRQLEQGLGMTIEQARAAILKSE